MGRLLESEVIMITRCTSGDRELVLRLLEKEMGEPAIYHSMPDFSYSVGGYLLKRDGTIEFEEDSHQIEVIKTLERLGLCECIKLSADLSRFELSERTAPQYDMVPTYSMEGHNGRTLMNLMCIVSARYRQINSALACPGAFYITPDLMDSILIHPPQTIDDFMRIIHGRDSEYRGVLFEREHIVLDGFRKGMRSESIIHTQLADLIMKEALVKRWIKPYTKNVRNRKYALRTWLSMIGMKGEEYEEARRIMLGRMYGRSDRRKINKLVLANGGADHVR